LFILIPLCSRFYPENEALRDVRSFAPWFSGKMSSVPTVTQAKTLSRADQMLMQTVKQRRDEPGLKVVSSSPPGRESLNSPAAQTAGFPDLSIGSLF